MVLARRLLKVLAFLALVYPVTSAQKGCTSSELAQLDALDDDKSVQAACPNITAGTLDCDDSQCVAALRAIRVKIPECLVNGVKATMMVDLAIGTCNAATAEQEAGIIKFPSSSSLGSSGSSTSADVTPTLQTPDPTKDDARQVAVAGSVIVASIVTLLFR